MNAKDLLEDILGKTSGTVNTSPAWILPCRGERLGFVLVGTLLKVHRSTRGITNHEFISALLFSIDLTDPNSIDQLETIKKEGSNADFIACSKS